MIPFGLTSRSALAVQAVLTVAVSLAVLSLIGAPVLAVQTAAYGIGGMAALALAATSGAPGPRVSVGVMCFAFAMVLVSLAGPGIEGVRRWMAVGPVLLQPAPLVLPLIAWVLAVRPAGWPVAGLAAGVALLFAAQPDPAASAALAAVIAAVVFTRRRATPAEIGALILSIAAFAWAVTRPDPLAPVNHVERVVLAAWTAEPAAGIAAAVMLALVPAPFLIRALRRSTGGGPALVHAMAALWVVLVLASVTQRFPAPAVGYGASFVIGWLISLGLLARKRAAVEVRTWAISPGGGRD